MWSWMNCVLASKPCQIALLCIFSCLVGDNKVTWLTSKCYPIQRCLWKKKKCKRNGIFFSIQNRKLIDIPFFMFCLKCLDSPAWANLTCTLQLPWIRIINLRLGHAAGRLPRRLRWFWNGKREKRSYAGIWVAFRGYPCMHNACSKGSSHSEFKRL
jgi:hypothetical protein